jgi:hypothetical protein
MELCARIQIIANTQMQMALIMAFHVDPDIDNKSLLFAFFSVEKGMFKLIITLYRFSTVPLLQLNHELCIITIDSFKNYVLYH